MGRAKQCIFERLFTGLFLRILSGIAGFHIVKTPKHYRSLEEEKSRL